MRKAACLAWAMLALLLGVGVGHGQADKVPADPAAQAWAAIKDTTSPEPLNAFIRQFGGSIYGDLARARLEEVARNRSTGVATVIIRAPVPHRVVLYEPDPGKKTGKRYVGSVLWSVVPVGSGPGVAVLADVEVPDRKLKMQWTLQSVADKTARVSHVFDVVFAESPHRGVQYVPSMLMKDSEQAEPTQLAAFGDKIAPGHFQLGLAANGPRSQGGAAMLEEWPWIEVPIVYNDGRTGRLAIEKGSTGSLAFKEAFAAWAPQGAASR